MKSQTYQNEYANPIDFHLNDSIFINYSYYIFDSKLVDM